MSAEHSVDYVRELHPADYHDHDHLGHDHHDLGADHLHDATVPHHRHGLGGVAALEVTPMRLSFAAPPSPRRYLSDLSPEELLVFMEQWRKGHLRLIDGTATTDPTSATDAHINGDERA